MKNSVFIFIITVILSIGGMANTMSIGDNTLTIEIILARQRIQKLRNDDLEERIKILESKR